ncbi:MAG: DUF1552 domain-containing protein [Bdellovibrionota bacterium]
MSKLLKRREFIQRMGLTTGSFLLNPILDTLIGEAWGQAITKKRILIYTTGGFMWPEWTATGGSNPNFTLPYILSPLEPFKKDLLVLRNLYCDVYPYFHGNLFGTLSGYPCLGANFADVQAYKTCRPGGPTIDTLLSNELGGGTRQKEMVITNTAGADLANGVGLAYARDQIKPALNDINQIFSTYISGISAPAPAPGVDPQRGLKIKKGILDFALLDIKKAYRGLASPEKNKFEQYLASVKDINDRLQITSNPPSTSVPSTCGGYKLPSTGTGLNGKAYPAIYPYALNRPGTGFCGNEYVMADMVALALACGATRHATFASHYSGTHQAFPDIGVPYNIHEQLGHYILNGVPDPASPVPPGFTVPMAVQAGKDILKFHADVFAKIYSKLKNTPEGNGTAADNTVLLWFSDMGGAHHDGHYGFTGIMLGNAGGALRSGNSYTYNRRQYSMCQLYLTLAKAMGSNITQVGNGTNPGSTVIPGILT